MCSTPDIEAGAATQTRPLACTAATVASDPSTEPWSDDEWEVLVAQSSEEARRSHWSRFVRLYGDESDPCAEAAISDDELLARLADAEALTTQLMALQARDLRRLRARRLAEQSSARPAGHDPDACTRGCCDGDGWMTLEVAQSLALSEHQVGRRLEAAERLERYRRVGAAARDGLLQSWTATKLLEHLDTLAHHVPAERLDLIEQASPYRRPARGTDATAAAPGPRPRRDRRRGSHRRRQAGASPSRRHQRAGHAHRPAAEADAVAVAGTLRALSELPVDPADSRTREQRRCDLLTASLTGLEAAHGREGDLDLIARAPGSLTVRLDVTVPVTSLTGGDAPAQVPGYGPVPASTARTLARMGHADVMTRPLVYDPASGRLLAAGTRHESGPGARICWLDDVTPSPSVMERVLHLRDGTCRAPGCSRRATACDCDHVVPHPKGLTSLANSCCLCRRHHRLKTHAPGWSLSLAVDGTASWLTPTGRTVTTEPADYRAWLEVPADTPPF